MSSSTLEEPVRTIARNLRRLRENAGVSLSTLAKAAGVGKGTLSSLEAGAGNPTIETLWALAKALDVPFGELLAPVRSPAVSVVRAGEGIEVTGSAGRLWLLDRVASDLFELFDMTFPAGQRHESGAHRAGVYEHILVISGRLITGPCDNPVELNAGDFVSFAADAPHLYSAPDGPARAVLVMNYPGRHRGRDMAATPEPSREAT